MGLVKQAQQIRCQIGRESLKVVIMSATLQIELFTNFFEVVVVVMSATLQIELLTNYFVVFLLFLLLLLL